MSNGSTAWPGTVSCWPISLSPTNWRLLLFAAYVLVSKYLEDGKPVRFGQMQMLWIAFDLQHGEPSSSSTDDGADRCRPPGQRTGGGCL